MELGGWALEYQLPRGCRVMVASPTNYTDYPPAGYNAISPYHLDADFRFSIPLYLKDLLNDLKLALFHLTPNTYA